MKSCPHCQATYPTHFAVCPQDGTELVETGAWADGALVRVTGQAEPLVEIAAANAQELARLAWHIGNRHTEVQIAGDKLRIRRDHVLEEMLRGLGATLAYVDAVFDPEHGAYAQDGHGHGH